MATKQTRLYFDDLAARLKTKFSISRVWFVSLNVADASLVIWKHAEPDPVKCGNLLWCISNTKTVLEVLAMKDGGTFVRLTLEPKNMDRQTSKTALGGDLLSAKDSQRHEAARMAEAKSAKSGRSAKGKGKVVVQETQKKKPSVPSQAPREKLLGSSFAAAAAETGRNSRESKTDSLKRKRESLVTPPPPPKVPVTETSESSEEEENIASDKEKSEESDSGSDSPLPSQPVNKKVSKLKTLKQMDKSSH
ncbi:hypothetical protein R1sor_002484 [Riccia sorocarpa]|uniref:Uncharacterized protein n=1 Tax=Riccia sorocarpa TaxID=122646 RepID=A0ABD3H1K3_9MARC